MGGAQAVVRGGTAPFGSPVTMALLLTCALVNLSFETCTFDMLMITLDEHMCTSTLFQRACVLLARMAVRHGT